MTQITRLKEIKHRSATNPVMRTLSSMQEDIESLLDMFTVSSATERRPAIRSIVYDAIDSERDFQDAREMDLASNGAAGDGSRTQYEFVLFVQEWSERLRRDSFILSHEDTQAGFRKVAALCVAAMEQHGSQRR